MAKEFVIKTGHDVRDKILSTACGLFYNQGIRAVGVDLVVEKAGVAKTSLYRHFGTKDDLVCAFLEHMDLEFWKDWDVVSKQYADDPKGELYAQLKRLGACLSEPDYRGCAQINIAAEFPERDHPARKIANAHKRELKGRLKVLAQRMGCANPDLFAGQMSMLINGAIVGSPTFDEPGEATTLLQASADALLSVNTAA